MINCRLLTVILFVITASANGSSQCLDIDLLDSSAVCATIFQPVCGCDGKTYANACIAEKFGGLTSWIDGECLQAKCLDSLLINDLILCAEIVDPVCGCDGQTYTNDCIAQHQFGITTWTQGPCPGAFCQDITQIDTSVVCPAIFDPVCGCDGRTYANDCEAQSNGIQSWTVGECTTICPDSNLINSLILCTAIYDPVCGCDRITYANECIARFHHGITQFTGGPCIPADCIDISLIDTTAVCTQEYDPVCGCDGITYSNECIATTQYGISSFTAGECMQSACVDTSMIDGLVLCIDIFDPVCGCDDQTYSNECVAQYHFGLTEWTEGECSTTHSLLKDNSYIILYPNPAKDVIHIEFEKSTSIPRKIELISVQGGMIWQGSTGKIRNIHIPVSDIPQGTYWIRMLFRDHVAILPIQLF